MDKEDIDNRFTYHAPKDGQLEIYQNIRTLAKEAEGRPQRQEAANEPPGVCQHPGN